MGAIDEITASISSFAKGDEQEEKYFHFEPWDVIERPKWMHDQARKDNIDLYSEDMIKHVGKDPHPFQTGFLLSSAFFRSMAAGTSVGKSITAVYEIPMMLTGVIPFSLRCDEGVDTGVKRMITEDNILRWGRRDSSTGALLDYDISAPKPRDWDEWDCGNIVGVGVYPRDKVAAAGSEYWVGTYMRAKDVYWWPAFSNTKNRVIPEFLIDKTRANKGYDKEKGIVYLVKDSSFTMITYESGYERFEAKRVHGINLDEEPADEKIVQAAQQHTRFFSMTETPYRGMTYSKGLFYPKKLSDENKTFHATQYDSPYQSQKIVDIKRENMNPWDIAARVWGMHSESTGKPYYDRSKITGWIHRYRCIYSTSEIVPGDSVLISAPDSPPVFRTEVTFRETEENQTTAWRIYEEPIEGEAYLCTVDPAQGSENPEDAADTCASLITRKPKDAERPIICATLRSTLEVLPFARVVAVGLQAYNNALLAAETTRAAANQAFAGELKDYQYWYHHVSVNNASGKPQKKIGWDTNKATRPAMFDMIGDWIRDFGPEEYPEIPDEPLLTELAACVVGKNGRPDHTGKGSLDTAICFGICLYVYRHAPHQVTCNKTFAQKERFPVIMKLLNRGTDTESNKSGYLAANLGSGR